MKKAKRRISKRELMGACREGSVLDGAGGSQPRPIDAELLRRVCLEDREGEAVDPRGIRLRNAVVVGVLDLAGVEVPFPLSFESCVFESAPVLDGADLHSLALTGCHRLPGLLANGLRVRRDVDLSRSFITGGHRTSASTSKRSAIWLCESEVGYSRAREGGTAVSAPRLCVGGEVAFEGACQVSGGVDLSLSELSALSIQGGCMLRAAGRRALDLTNAELRSGLLLDGGATVEGTVRLSGARIHGNLTMQQTVLRAPEGRSLLAAPGLVVDGDVELQGLRATGGRLLFRNAMLGGALDAEGAKLDNPDGQTLSAHQAIVKSSVRLTHGFESRGFVLLNRSTIEGRLDTRGGSFYSSGASHDNIGGHALEASSATIRGGMYLGWRKIAPSVDFTNTTTTILADDPANWPERFVVSGLAYDRFEEPEETDSDRAWDRRLRCAWLARQSNYDSGPYEQAARVFRQHGYVTEAEEILMEQRTQARRAGRARRSPIRRAVDALYHVSVGYGYRPSRVLWILLSLLVLVTFSLTLPAAKGTLRATDARGNVYTASGRLVTVDSGAAGTSEPPQNRSGRPPVTEDYSKVAPTRPHPDACGEGQVRCFNAALYAIDTVVPLVTLDQRSTWYANPNAPWGQAMEWWLNAATLIGWLLTSIFLLSFTRLARAT